MLRLYADPAVVRSYRRSVDTVGFTYIRSVRDDRPWRGPRIHARIRGTVESVRAASVDTGSVTGAGWNDPGRSTDLINICHRHTHRTLLSTHPQCAERSLTYSLTYFMISPSPSSRPPKRRDPSTPPPDGFSFPIHKIIEPRLIHGRLVLTDQDYCTHRL